MKRIQTLTAVANFFGLGKNGFTDGNPTVGLEATDLEARFFNQVQESIVRVEEAAGLTPADDYDQFLNAILKLIEARVGDYSLDTGVANAYVIALDPPITSYPTTTLQVQYKASNTSTLIAPTLNAGGGALTLVRGDGSALAPGDVVAGAIITATRDPATNKFYINSIVPSQAMSQAAADARYAALAGLASQLFSVADATSAKHAINRDTGDARYAQIGSFLGLFASSGYIKIPASSGPPLIIQWSSVNTTMVHGSNYVVPFPIAFPNAMLKVIQGVGPTVNTATTATWAHYVSNTLTGATFQFGSTNGAAYATTVSAIAIGY